MVRRKQTLGPIVRIFQIPLLSLALSLALSHWLGFLQSWASEDSFAVYILQLPTHPPSRKFNWARLHPLGVTLPRKKKSPCQSVRIMVASCLHPTGNPQPLTGSFFQKISILLGRHRKPANHPPGHKPYDLFSPFLLLTCSWVLTPFPWPVFPHPSIHGHGLVAVLFLFLTANDASHSVSETSPQAALC